jgi:tetratricopeptide (TPR) repeat protein
MRRMHHRLPGALPACGLLLAGVLAAGGPALARQRDASLDTAKARYGAAAYEEALAILGAAKPSESDLVLRAEIEKYRTLCLLALGRKDDAERAIERLVTLSPSLNADHLEASPWVRDTFRAARRRVLPSVVALEYEQGKAAVLRKSFQEASGHLKEVLGLLDDADLATSDERWRRDLRTLAQGFLDLAVAASASPPSFATATAAQPITGAAPADSTIVPAAAVREDMPPWPQDLRKFMGARETAAGVIEVTVDENGRVDNAVMRESIHPMYDALLVEVARTTWRYRPATKAGVPVRDTRRIRLVVNLR